MHQTETRREIFISFNYPMHYVSHDPKGTGSVLHVLLKPVSETKWKTTADIWNNFEAWDWRPTQEVPLKRVTYEGMQEENVQVILRFDRLVNYEVRSLPDKKTLVVSIASSDRQDITPGNVPEKGYTYAINLKSSVRPIDKNIAESIPALGSHKIYIAKNTSKERTWYRLRAGFFDDFEKAKQTLEQVSETFPHAWVAVANEENRLIVSDEVKETQAEEKPGKEKATLEDKIEAIISDKQVDPSNEFAVNLSSSREEINDKDIPSISEFDDQLVYMSRATIDGAVWYRLRLGFFETEAAAEAARKGIATIYPAAAVIKPETKERYIAAGIAEPDAPVSIADGLSIGSMKRPPEQKLELAPKPEILPEPAAAVSIAAEPKIILGPPVPVPEIPAQSTLDKTIPDTEQLIPEVKKPTSAEDEKIAGYMEQARQAMAKGDYSRAIALYNKVLQLPPNPYQQDALEFLGLARERKGQLAHAKAEYEKFLGLYPDGAAATRVKQRLAGLLTARKTPREKLAKTARKRDRSEWDFFGGVSQFYRRDVNITDDQGDIITQESLATDFDFTARKRTEKYSFGSRVVAGYLNDFRDNEDNDTRVSSLYFDLADSGRKYFVRAGRQSRSTGGVLGRFDGGLFSYQFNKKLKANIVAGSPVDRTKDGLESNRVLYGASLDIGTIAKAWDFTAFAIEQTNSGLIDRRAVGGEARYFDPQKSLFTLVDYDVFYNSLNNALFLGNFTLKNKTTFSMTLDYRNSPVLTTNNAISGQPVSDFEDLQDLFTDDEIHQLAEDVTTDSTTITLSVSYPFNKKYQVNSDISYSKFSEIPPSDIVTPDPDGTDPDPGSLTTATIPSAESIFFSTQLIGNGLFKEGDISILGLRYSDTDTANTISLSLNSRYPFTKNLRLNPRLRIDLRDNETDDSTQWTVAPSLRMDYRWRRRLRFEADIGGEWSTRDIPDTEDTKAYFFSLGYRYDF